MRRVKRSLVFQIPFPQEDSLHSVEQAPTCSNNCRNSVASQTSLSGPSAVTATMRSSTASLVQPTPRRSSLPHDTLKSILANFRPTSAQSPICLVLRKKFRSVVPETRKRRAFGSRQVFGRQRRRPRFAAAKQPLYLVQGISPMKVSLQVKLTVPQ